MSSGSHQLGYGAFARTWRGRTTPYDISAHEGAEIAAGLPWTTADVVNELRRRAEYQIGLRELVVDYYRVGHSFAYELPIERLTSGLPQGILGDVPYPWRTWLGWELEERWYTFSIATRTLDQADGQRSDDVLALDLEALGRWPDYNGDDGAASLITGSLAGVLAEVLRAGKAHQAGVVGAASAVGSRLMGETVWPWFQAKFTERPPYQRHYLFNIRCIVLFQAAQLATAISHERAATLQQAALDLYRAWIAHRLAQPSLTEGPAYDGYLLDAMTRWLEARPDRDDLLSSGQDALLALLPSWAAQSLPGRPDLLVPLGDVEAEMTHWAGVAMRVCQWFGGDDHRAWLRQFPLTRLPANALGYAAEMAAESPEQMSQGVVTDLTKGRHQAPSCVTIRTGGGSDDLVAAVSAPQYPLNHLHLDGGHVVVAWEGRTWITDPGYQQYRESEEREYTIGPDAHNAPVIDGHGQDTQATLVEPEGDLGQRTASATPLHVGVNLTSCYGSLSGATRVRRDVWLSGRESVVLVRDEFTGFAEATEIRTSWLGGAGLAWAFVDGWARLSDGRHVLWFTSLENDLQGDQVTRHPGSRGPVHLRQVITTDGVYHQSWWVFATDAGRSWSPPRARLSDAVGSLPTADLAPADLLV